MADQVSIVIPAYNEGSTIAATIIAIENLAAVNEIIVVDDGSWDDTAKRAREAGAIVYKCNHNLGKGSALNIGAALAKGQIIVFLDGDLGETAREAVRLWQPILAGEADCVIARFPQSRKKGGFGLVKQIANWGTKYYGGQQIPAVLSGQRAMSRAALEAIFPFASDYGAEVAGTIRLLKRGFRLKEVDVEMTHRETGRDWAGFYHRGRQFQHILKVLAKEALG